MQKAKITGGNANTTARTRLGDTKKSEATSSLHGAEHVDEGDHVDGEGVDGGSHAPQLIQPGAIDSMKPSGLFYTEPDAKERLAKWNTKGWKSALTPITPERMAELTAQAKEAIDTVQADTTKKNGGHTLRAQHAKATYQTADGKLKIAANLPKELAVGMFQPGTELRSIVRLSNVRGAVQNDNEPDLRGIAIRFTDDKGKVQDILLNTTPDFFAPDAAHTLAGAQAREGGAKGFLGLLGGVLFGDLNRKDATRMIKGGKAAGTKDISLAAHTFWSRVPFRLGDHAVKFRLVPADDVSPTLGKLGPNQLKDDIEDKLKAGPVRYKLQIQGYRDEKTTPMEDTRVVWDTPFVTVGELTLPQMKESTSADDRRRVKSEVEHMSFSPFNTWFGKDAEGKDATFLEPLGEINAVRKGAYDESAKNRGVDPKKRLGCPLGFG